MAKWADYMISAVCYDDNGDRIVKVERYASKYGDPTRVKKSRVVRNLEKGKTYVTIRKDNGDWKKGEDVHIVSVGGEKFIKTNENKKETDNLGDLPEFSC